MKSESVCDLPSLSIEQMKDIFKQSLEISNTPNELFKVVFELVYQAGYKDGKNDILNEDDGK